MKRIASRTKETTMLRSIHFRALARVSLFAAPFAVLALPSLARAEVKCGSIAGGWSAPRGAVVIEKSGDGPIAKLLEAIGEHHSHSMLSHGPYTMSHATRTDAAPKEDANCDKIFDVDDLKNGFPGAERVDMGAAYAFLFGDAALGSQAQDALLYYEPVNWGMWVPGECQNPRATFPAGTLRCDPIPGCPNPRVDRPNSPGPGYVTCDPIPTCTSTPIVKGNRIYCGAAESGCATGGHIDTSTGAFVCNGIAKTWVCTAWQGTTTNCKMGGTTCPDDDDNPHKHTGKCLWYQEVDINLDELDGSEASFATPYLIPSVPNEDGVAYSSRQVSPQGAQVAEFLERIAPGDGMVRYGIPYDFYQYADINTVNTGTIPPGEGVVCSSFLAWAQNKQTGQVAKPYRYGAWQERAARDALFSAVHDACESQTGWYDKTKFALACQNVTLSPCTLAARPVVNCFALNRCDTGSEDVYNSIVSDGVTPYAISPEGLVGVGFHANPLSSTDPNVEANSIWARDVGTPVSFSAGSTYTCWE
jgi:hypothetical protein